MPQKPFFIDPDIRSARTLPGAFYRDMAVFERIREKIFLDSWHFSGPVKQSLSAGEAEPFRLLPGFLDEPLVWLTDTEGNRACFSNVCTHRGNLLVEEACSVRDLRCRYHGRRFDLKGKCVFMPEFEEVADFPAESDHLPQLSSGSWNGLSFISLGERRPFADWIEPVRERIDGLYPKGLTYSPDACREYTVKAHWALYCENYLEGFHIPFVHPALNRLLSYPDYGYELFGQGNLQIGIARKGENAFKLPDDSPDVGKQVAAYYFWMFPNLMLNFYPWGLSINVVEPISPGLTRIRFETFVGFPERLGPDILESLHQTEIEDEAIVERVQEGIRSRLYRHGRYSPEKERGVHHFHRLLADRL